MNKFFYMGASVKNHLSRLCIICIALWWVFSFSLHRRWEKNPIEWDVISYYAYLPATFIYKDITLNFIEKDPRFFGMKFWPEKSPNGGKVIKTSMGVSILYSPFFFLGHLYANLSGESQDGFSGPYQVFLQIGTLFYLILGFIFLRGFLLNYFQDKVVFLVILSLFFGTNLLFYATGGALMAHSYVFFVSCIFIWATLKWHNFPDIKSSIILGLTGGLLIVIRPTMILFVLFPLLLVTSNINSLQEKFQLIKNNKWKILLIIICYVLPGIPQIIYWKYITGHWLYFSYTNERFYWNNPHILEGLFSYRNGWLLYTPIMSFSIIGIFLMKEKLKQMRLPVILILASFIYVFHSWWCWWHGGFGLRAYIDIYALLAIPMASFYNHFISKKMIMRTIALTLTVLLICLNIFQEWQFERGLIHYAWMTKKSYWLSFLKTNVSGTYWQCLKETDCERIVRGLPEIDEKEKAFSRYDVIKEIGFENVPEDKSRIYFSSRAFNSGKRALLLTANNTFSPSINLTGREVLSPVLKGKRLASVSFFSEEEIKPEEIKLILSIENDTGIYYHHAQDFYSVSSEPKKWNQILFEIPLQEIKSNNAMIKIFVLSESPHKEVFIDDLKYQIGHYK